MAKPLAVLAVIAAIVLGILLWRSHRPDAVRAPPVRTTRAPPPASATSASAASPAPHEPRAHVGRLASPDQRRAIADRIAAAQVARAAQAAAKPPELADDHSHDLERAAPKLREALDEAIPILAECYKTGAMTQKRPAVQLVVSGDEVSTLIDAQQMTDPDGKPVEGELESCLRTTLASLELPPLGNTAPIHLQYSFRFDDE